MDRRFMFMKNNVLRGVVCLCPGAIYMYMTIIFKQPLGQSNSNFMWSIVKKGERKFI